MASRKVDINMHGRFTGKGILEDQEFYIPYDLIEKAYKTEKIWQDSTLKIHVTKGKYLDTANYDYKGNYLHFDKNYTESWGVEFDKQGIPKTVYAFGKYYNPATVSHLGLQHYSRYLITKKKENKETFLKAADWLVRNQDGKGGWPYLFNFSYVKARKLELKAPWYSSIGNGLAMSLLTRVFHETKNPKYTQSALKGLGIFSTPVSQKGVLAKYEGKYFFYEECPTIPSSYILNGFMYSLLGLFDVYKTTNDKNAAHLYEEGIKTLKRMLPLYDMGNRTAYDLSHHTTNGGFPLIAKWGYHITHIHLLAAINSIEKDPKFTETLARWKGYLEGRSLPY